MTSTQGDGARQAARAGVYGPGSIWRDLWGVFLVSLLVRLGLSFALGTEYNSGNDSHRYDQLSDRVLALNFDFEGIDFIVSPLYPILLALIKLAGGSHWLTVTEIAQSTLSALETVFLYLIATLLWNERRIALLAALGHTFYPPNLKYVTLIGQEPLFELLWVICIYWLLVSGRQRGYRGVILSAIFFGLGYLTKSHILLFAPFVCVHYLLNSDSVVDAAKRVAIFGAVSFAMSIPWGVHNWRTKNAYILSSSGYGSHFLGGHNDDYFQFLFDTPPLGSAEWLRLSGWQNSKVFMEIFEIRRETGMSDKEFQKLCYATGLKWCRENPDKYYRLKVTDAARLFRPGVSRKHYTFRTWLASLLVCGPMFLMAYAGIVRNLLTDFRLHFWILGIILMMLLYVVSFCFQGRFRVVTIEQFYLVYAAFTADRVLAWLSKSRAASSA